MTAIDRFIGARPPGRTRQSRTKITDGMGQSENSLRGLRQKATDRDSLETRSDANRAFGTADFDAWIRAITDRLRFESVLDLGCGTGNQLVIYAARPDIRRIVGIDMSAESLEVAADRLRRLGVRDRCHLVRAEIETAFAQPVAAGKSFDLIASCYSLYYSKDVGRSLREITEHVSDDGTVLIVGPHGANNASIFDLLQRHFRLPEFVLRSSTTFMTDSVLPALADGFNVATETFVNRVHYPSAAAVLAYWKASTFYDSSREALVARDLQRHFDVHGEFITEKHVMAAVARKVQR